MPNLEDQVARVLRLFREAAEAAEAATRQESGAPLDPEGEYTWARLRVALGHAGYVARLVGQAVEAECPLRVRRQG